MTALCAVAALGAGSAGAADQTAKNADRNQADKTLEQVERAIEEEKARAEVLGQRSSEISRDLDLLRTQMIDAARATQEQEAQITELEGTLDELRAAENEKAETLEERRAQLSKTLAALERLALYPPEALAALPESPVDTVRSALLLRAAVPAIDAQARRLRDDLDTLRNLRAQISAERRTLEAAKRDLANDHLRLATLFERKGELYQENESARRAAEDHMTQLTSRAKDLRELMDRIEAERAEREAAARAKRDELARAKPSLPPAQAAPGAGPNTENLASLGPGQPPTIRPISGAQGRLTLPARGEIVKEFGANEEFGATSKGITIRTRPGAQVVASYDGQVVYAGPFRGYGQILIIEHSEGYHTLLSGLSRIDAASGQWVLAGEPVGVMGPPEHGSPELYVELRRNGRPINPLPWLALHNGKVSG